MISQEEYNKHLQQKRIFQEKDQQYLSLQEQLHVSHLFTLGSVGTVIFIDFICDVIYFYS